VEEEVEEGNKEGDLNLSNKLDGDLMVLRIGRLPLTINYTSNTNSGKGIGCLLRKLFFGRGLGECEREREREGDFR
jgi:hypothetical protein